ncbi:hypothetical protein HWV62_12114 [Athelia sp. TMB]|nr:hypothetical protein HWV62_12114 [Athelia sp. TMB]
MRSSVTATAPLQSGGREALQKGADPVHQESPEYIDERSLKHFRLGLNFLWDPRDFDFMNDERACEERVKDASIVVVSTVAHFDETETLEVFSQGRKITLGAVEHQDEFVRKYRDYGANLRMIYWRDGIKNILLELGWQLVDQFEHSLLHSIEPPHTDMAHFLAYNALDPIVDELLGETGLCD